MKFLKKIAPLAVIGLLGVTCFAAADLTSWPTDFAGGAVVIGSGAATSDLLVATTDIAGMLGLTTILPSGKEVTESAQLKGTGTELYIANKLKETLDDGDLDLLLLGTYSESVGEKDNDIDYDQYLTIDPDNNIVSGYQANTEVDGNPSDMFVYIPNDGTNVYKYKLSFKGDGVQIDKAKADADVKATNLEIMGKSYTISKLELSGNTISKLILLSGATEIDVQDETPVTTTLGSTSYTITPDIYADDSVKLTITYGTVTKTTDKMKGGDTYQLDEETQIGIKDVWYSTKESKTSSVSVYLGSHEVELNDNDVVKVDDSDENTEDSLVVITDSYDAGTGIISLTDIEISIPVIVDTFLAEGDSWEDPAFEAFSLRFGGLNEDTTTNIVDVTTSSSSGYIEFENSAGEPIKLNLDKTAVPIAVLGKETTADAQSFLWDAEALTLAASSDDHYFVVTTNAAGANAHLFKIDDVKTATAPDEIKIKDITGDRTETFTGIADLSVENAGVITTKFGDWNFKVATDAADAGVTPCGNTAGICVIDGTGRVLGEALGSDAVTADQSIMLKDGATIGIEETAGAGTEPRVYMSEDGTRTGKIFFDVKYTALTFNELQVIKPTTPVVIAHDDDSKSYTAYTDWGAKLEWNSDNYDLTITSTEVQTEVQAYVDSVVTAGSAGTSGYSPITDTEVIANPTTYADKPLVAIGGSAINEVAAGLLGLPFKTYGTEEAWKTATGVTGEGMGIIKIWDAVDNPAFGKIAMLVAGYSAADTATLGDILRTGTPALTGKEALINTAGQTVITV